MGGVRTTIWVSRETTKKRVEGIEFQFQLAYLSENVLLDKSLNLIYFLIFKEKNLKKKTHTLTALTLSSVTHTKDSFRMPLRLYIKSLVF